MTKSAQMGLTERSLSEAIWLADIKGVNVLYCFPASSQLQDMVQARLDPVLLSSDYFRQRIGLDAKEEGKSDDKADQKMVAKMGLKRIGTGHVYFRGSQNQSQIITIDADCVILDERDRFMEENVPYIEKRLLASELSWRRDVSTPTRPGVGIDLAYQNSDKRIWQIPCESCGFWQELDFFKHVDFQRYCLRCEKCAEVMKNRLGDGRWLITNPEEKDVHGYKINGLYNPTRDIKYFIKKYRKAQISGFSELTQFFNQDLGLAYDVGGQSISPSEIDNCQRSYMLPMQVTNNTYLGCDIGSSGVHHAAVVQKLSDNKTRIVWVGTVTKFQGPFDSIESLIRTFQVKRAVVDKRPEVSRVKELMELFPLGVVFAAEYPPMRFPVGEHAVWDDVKLEVKLDRTVAIDYVVADIQNQNLELPMNIKSVEGFYEQLRAVTRITERNPRTGVEVARWEDRGADHYLHALVYARVAQSRESIGKALLDYYTEAAPTDILSSPLSHGLVDWIRINGQRINT